MSSIAVETNESQFESDVFEQSLSKPVVLDFWADWCAPCRMLAPIMEEAIEKRGDKIRLVKANLDHVGKYAQEFGVQGIPAVYAIWKKELVGNFTGVIAPDQFERWLDELTFIVDRDEIRDLEASDAAAALKRWQQLLEKHPHEIECQVGLARTLSLTDQPAAALEILDKLADVDLLNAEGKKLHSSLKLGDSDGAEIETLRAKLSTKPADAELRLELAKALAAGGEHQAALDECLQVVELRNELKEDARKLMLDIFEVCPDEQVVRDYRRKLSLLLY